MKRNKLQPHINKLNMAEAHEIHNLFQASAIAWHSSIVDNNDSKSVFKFSTNFIVKWSQLKNKSGTKNHVKAICNEIIKYLQQDINSYLSLQDYYNDYIGDLIDG